MSSPVELIVGPARSGKAAYVVRAYLDAYARAGPGRCLMLVPTAARRRATESRLLAAQPRGVLVLPQVLTLPDLAERLLTAAGTPVQRITELARRQLIRECLARLDGKQAAVLGPVRDAPGLVEALDALFRELKAARVEPDAFGRALAGRLRSPRNRLLAHLYGAYQQALQERDVYDDAGAFWHAAQLVAEGRFGPFADLALLAADGFQDFAPAQIDMLESLSTRAARTVITLPWQPDRPKLFGLTGRTRERLLARFGPRLREVPLDEPADLPPDLDRVRRHLFRLADSEPAPQAQVAKGDSTGRGAIREVRAAGRTREVEEAARQIVDLVRAGPARPGSIAVIARSLEPYAALVREVFPRYGIAFHLDRPRPLTECPVIRAAMALIRLQTEDYAFRALARVLKSNYFRPEAFGADAETARAAVRAAREANVWEGRESYATRLGYLKNQLRRAAEGAEAADEYYVSPERAAERIAQIDRAAALLDRLFAALELPEGGTRAALADRLRRMLRQAGLWEAVQEDADPHRRARDLAALAALESVLQEVARLEETGRGQVPLETFLAEVTQGLYLESVPAEEPPAAPVVVIDASRGRALGFDHVFLLGLAEKGFPQRGRRHPFFDDTERRDLRRRGVELQDAGHDAEHEMLLFYLAATRAARTLTVSYPTLDAQGRLALPSHYLEQLTGLFAGGLPAVDVGTRDLDLPQERVRSERELLALSMFRVWGPGETPDMDERLAALGSLVRPHGAAEAALAGLAAEWEREHGEALGPFDGILASPDIREELCRQVPGEVSMSARRLELFGGCPFAYLASELLGLETVEEPSRELGPLDVGVIYHALLERFFRALVEEKKLDARLTEAQREAAHALLEDVAAACFQQLQSQGRVGSPALWKVQARTMLRDLRALVDWHVDSRDQPNWRPTYLEVSFGSSRARPPGRQEPLVLATPHGDLRLRGRIDRVDRAVAGEGYQVIDYKSGSSAPTAKDMAAGVSFQLPIYLWAAAALLGEPPEDAPTQAYFLPIRSPSRTGLLRSLSGGERSERFDRDLDRARRYVENFLEAMRQGKFPVYPRWPGGCPPHCNFQEICRYAEWRIRRKWEASPIPELASLADEPQAQEDRA